MYVNHILFFFIVYYIIIYHIYYCTYYTQHTLTLLTHTTFLSTIMIGYMGDFRTRFDVENMFTFKNGNR